VTEGGHSIRATIYARSAIETRILHKPTVIFIFVRQQALEKRPNPVADHRRSIHCPANAVLGY
jgi:hypothetical protein